MTPLDRETLFSSPFLPATPSSPSLTLEGFFELTRQPSKTLKLSSCVASGTTEIQGYHQVCCARPGGPKTLTDANLDTFTLFMMILDCNKQT